MAKRKYNNNRNSKSRSKKATQPVSTLHPEMKPNIFFRLGRFVLKNWKSLVAILALFPTCLIIYDRFFKSDRAKFNQENVLQGYIQSPKLTAKAFAPLKDHPSFVFNTVGYHYPLIKGILIKELSKKNKRDWIGIKIGGYLVLSQIGSLYQGIDLLNPNYSDCSNAVLGLVAKNDRLYVWAKFIDLITENEIGEMDLNHWKIYNGTYLDYRANDECFEVKDHKGNIVFSISFNQNKGEGLSVVSIAGYFSSTTSILVLKNDWGQVPANGHFANDDMFRCINKSDSNWLRKSEIEIAKIKSTF